MALWIRAITDRLRDRDSHYFGSVRPFSLTQSAWLKRKKDFFFSFLHSLFLSDCLNCGGIISSRLPFIHNFFLVLDRQLTLLAG